MTDRRRQPWTRIEFTCCPICAGQVLADLRAEGHQVARGGCPHVIFIALPEDEAIETLQDYGFGLAGGHAVFTVAHASAREIASPNRSFCPECAEILRMLRGRPAWVYIRE